MTSKKLSALVLTVVSLCLSLLSLGQARENPKEITFTQRSPGKITSAKGWIKSPETGKWVSHQNYVSGMDMGGGEGIAPGFNWIAGAAFTHKGDKYFVFYYSYPTGTWTYPALHQGWNPFNSMGYVVMDLPQYGRLYKAVQTETAARIAVDGNYLMKPASTEAPLLTDITKYLNEEPNKFKMTGMDKQSFQDTVFADVQTISGKKIVRFDATGVLAMSGAERDGYFETDLALFKQILVPMTPAEQALGDSLVKAGDPALKAAKAEAARAAKDKADKEARELKEKQEAKAAADKVIKDSIEQYNNTLGKIKNWKTGDTLVLTGLPANNMLLESGKPQWMVISSFTYEGKPKYIVCTKYLTSSGTPEVYGVVVEPAAYASLKEALSAKDNEDFNLSSAIWAGCYKAECNFMERLYEKLSTNPALSETCLSLNASKKRVQFLPPSISDCNKVHNFKDKYGTGYYELSPEVFSKLISLP